MTFLLIIILVVCALLTYHIHRINERLENLNIRVMLINKYAEGVKLYAEGLFLKNQKEDWK